MVELHDGSCVGHIPEVMSEQHPLFYSRLPAERSFSLLPVKAVREVY